LVRTLTTAGLGHFGQTLIDSARSAFVDAGASECCHAPRSGVRQNLGVVILGNDEIEVACDALWFVKSRGAVDAAQDALWNRLQTLRTGDVGGSAQTELDSDETAAAFRALRSCASQVPLDEDERRLLQRLEAL
jgi:hypothetical protein